MFEQYFFVDEFESEHETEIFLAFLIGNIIGYLDFLFRYFYFVFCIQQADMVFDLKRIKNVQRYGKWLKSRDFVQTYYLDPKINPS